MKYIKYTMVKIAKKKHQIHEKYIRVKVAENYIMVKIA